MTLPVEESIMYYINIDNQDHTELSDITLDDISVSSYSDIDPGCINESFFDIVQMEIDNEMMTMNNNNSYNQVPYSINTVDQVVSKEKPVCIDMEDDCSSINATPSNTQAAVVTPKPKRQTWKKPEGMPKRPMSAYNLYFQLERERLLKEEPETIFTKDDVERIVRERKRLDMNPPKEKRKHRKSHGKLSFRDMARVIANSWKKLSPSEKKVFNERAAIEKHLYTKAVEEWSKENKNDNNKKGKQRQIATATYDQQRSLKENKSSLMDNKTSSKGGTSSISSSSRCSDSDDEYINPNITVPSPMHVLENAENIQLTRFPESCYVEPIKCNEQLNQQNENWATMDVINNNDQHSYYDMSCCEQQINDYSYYYNKIVPIEPGSPTTLFFAANSMSDPISLNKMLLSTMKMNSTTMQTNTRRLPQV